MFPKSVTQASAGFSYVAFITCAALDKVYQVSGGTYIPMMNVNVSIRRVINSSRGLTHAYVLQSLVEIERPSQLLRTRESRR